MTASAQIATTAASPDAMPSESNANAILDDPGSAYTTEVKTALVDAMLDYGTSIPSPKTNG